MKKRCLVVCCLVACFFLSEFANASGELLETRKPFEATLSSKFISKYVDEAGVVVHNRPVIQTEVYVRNAETGIYLDIFYSTSVKNPGRDSNSANEVNYTIGWSKTVGPIDLDAGISYIDLTPLNNGAQGDAVKTFMAVSKEFNVIDGHKVTPFIRMEYGFSVKGNAAESSSGLQLHSGIKHAWQISEKLLINQKLMLVFDDGSYGMNRGWIGSYEVGPSYRINEWVSLDANFRVVGPLHQINDGRKEQFIGMIGLTFYF